MGRHDATICMNESVARLPDLARTGLSGHLLPGLYRMGHAARHTAVPEDSRPPWVFSGSTPPAAKSPARARCAAPPQGAKANFFQQHGEGDGEKSRRWRGSPRRPGPGRPRQTPAAQPPRPCTLQYVFHGRRCCWRWAWPTPTMATAAWSDGWSDTTSAMAPSEMGQQSSNNKGRAMGLEANTSCSVMGVRKCAPGWLGAHEYGKLGHVLRSDAREVHVLRGHERVVSGHRGAVRHFVIHVAHLRQRLDGTVAGLARETVFRLRAPAHCGSGPSAPTRAPPSAWRRP